MHPYEKLPLYGTGLVVAVCLIVTHLFLLLKHEESKAFLKKFPRNDMWGQILIAIGLGWFWLLIAPDGWGIFSSLQLDLGDFNKAKPILRVVVPICIIAVPMSCRDFMSVRALGLIGLLLAHPLLEAAFLKDPASRIILPLYAYGVLTASLYMVGMPYLFRDALNWVLAKSSRWNVLCVSGLAYGVLMLVCALAFWKNY